jgi:NADPH:quinone reductase-like Zn-dependent oxidoreductase
VLSGANDPATFPINTILHKQVHLRGIYVGSRKDFEDLNRAITLAVLRPVGENFHWSQAGEALARMEEGSHFGKLVLTVG